MATLDTALEFDALGYEPVVVSGKRPVDRKWQERIVSRDELLKRFGNNPGLNIGVKLGGAGMLADADCDGEGAEEELARLCGGTIPYTWSYDSARGPHFIFEGDPRITGKRQSGKLELRFGPGMQTVLPPSNGRKWRVSPQDLARPAKLPASVIAWALEQKVKAAPAAPRETPRTPEDDYSDHGPPWPTILGGWTDLGNGSFKRPGKEHDGQSANVVRAQDGRELLKVFSTNAPLPPGNYNKFDAYRLLSQGGDEDKAAKAIRAEGYGARRHLQVFKTGDLLRLDARVTYVVDGVLVQGQPGIVAGMAKTLKTSIAADLAISAATGSPFLGHIDVPNPCPVCFMSGESGLGTLQETFRRIIRTKGLGDDDADDVSICPETIRLDRLDDVEAVERWLRDTGAKVLILDPTYLMCPGDDAGNLMAQGAILDGIRAMCQRMGASLLLVHHIKKGVKNEYAPPQLGGIAWAGFQEFARQWILLGRRETYTPGTGEHRLWLSVGGSAGHGNLWQLDVNEGVYPDPRVWDVQLAPHAEAKKEDIGPLILAALGAGPNNLTGLREAIGKPTTIIAPAIEALRQAGKVVPAQVRRDRGRSYPGFQLAT